MGLHVIVLSTFLHDNNIVVRDAVNSTSAEERRDGQNSRDQSNECQKEGLHGFASEEKGR